MLVLLIAVRNSIGFTDLFVFVCLVPLCRWAARLAFVLCCILLGFFLLSSFFFDCSFIYAMFLWQFERLPNCFSCTRMYVYIWYMGFSFPCRCPLLLPLPLSQHPQKISVVVLKANACRRPEPMYSSTKEPENVRKWERERKSGCKSETKIGK